MHGLHTYKNSYLTSIVHKKILIPTNGNIDDLFHIGGGCSCMVLCMLNAVSVPPKSNFGFFGLYMIICIHDIDASLMNLAI